MVIAKFMPAVSYDRSKCILPELIDSESYAYFAMESTSLEYTPYVYLHFSSKIFYLR